MPTARADLYVVLGVARSATVAELRREYRKQALAHHPDRAGAASAATFARIADAYRVLSDPVARSAYDASLVEEEAWGARAAGAVHAGGVDWTVSTNSWKAGRSAPLRDLLPRVSGPIQTLVASRIVAIHDDGSIDLHLNAREAASGGTAAIQMPLSVVCATCGGVARPRGVWCRICEHAGRITEDVTVQVRVAAFTHPGTVLSISPPRVVSPPLKVRVLVHGLRPQPP